MAESKSVIELEIEKLQEKLKMIEYLKALLVWANNNESSKSFSGVTKVVNGWIETFVKEKIALLEERAITPKREASTTLPKKKEVLDPDSVIGIEALFKSNVPGASPIKGKVLKDEGENLIVEVYKGPTLRVPKTSILNVI